MVPYYEEMETRALVLKKLLFALTSTGFPWKVSTWVDIDERQCHLKLYPKKGKFPSEKHLSPAAHIILNKYQPYQELFRSKGYNVRSAYVLLPVPPASKMQWALLKLQRKGEDDWTVAELLEKLP